MSQSTPNTYDQSQNTGGDIKRKAKPKDLVLHEMEYRKRDSGCFTGSPASVSSASQPGIHFRFESSSEHTHYPPFHESGSFEDSTELPEDVFQMSEEFSSTNINAEDDAGVMVGNSRFYLSSNQIDQTDSVRDESDDDNDTPTEEEPPITITAGNVSPSSTPIDIPITSTPYRRRLRASFPGRTYQTQSTQCEPPDHDERPRSTGTTDVIHRQVMCSQSMDGAPGPLPDVVPSNALSSRNRTQSESAIYIRPDGRAIGTMLAGISDEFSLRTLTKRRNTLHIETLAEETRSEERQVPHSNSVPDALQGLVRKFFR